jgi:hypothetical protein
MNEADLKIKQYLKIRPMETPPYCGRMNSKRQDLVNILKLLNVKTGAEIGVDKGDFSLALFKEIPKLKMICVDPWHGESRRAKRKMKIAHEKTKQQLKNYDAQIIKDTSLNAVKNIKDESLDFIHIDGNHSFDFCITDLVFWSHKVKIGGIISGHDYMQHYRFGVIEAVNAYTRAHNIIDWYLVKGNVPTYFWVKKEKIIDRI